jgi:nicotinamidase-related amidase
MGKVALILIDLQEGFFDRCNSWYVPGIDDLLDILTVLCEVFPKEDVFFTKFINMNIRQEKNESSKFLTNSPESKINEKFKKYILKENVFDKNGYSIFKTPALLNKMNNYKKIYLAGVEAEACVLFSLAEAYDLNLNTKLIIDAVAGYGVFGNVEMYKDYCIQHFGDCVVTSKEFLDIIRN